jgi:hypothetical protein
MNIPPREDGPIRPEYKENAKQIFNAVQDVEIDMAISLLNWCGRKLLEQKCTLNQEFLRAVLEGTPE